MRGPEGKLQDKILKDLRSYGKFIVCTKVMKASDNGFPDIFFSTALTGAVLIETKREDGEAAKIQELRIKQLNERGSRAFVCNTWEGWIAIKQSLDLPSPSDMALFTSNI